MKRLPSPSPAARLGDVPSLAVILGLVLILYRPSMGFGFNSDAFVLFGNASKSFFAALGWDHSYHYMPVTSLWIWFQHLFLGTHQQAYQVVNLLQHGVMAGMAFLLARRLGLPRGLALFAGILFAVAGSSYQVALWSIVGCNYFVSGMFYLIALMFFIRNNEEKEGRSSWWIPLLFAMALLSHEQSLSLLPACVAFSLLVLEAKDGRGLQQILTWMPWRRTLQRVLPMFGVLGAFVGMKVLMSSRAAVAGFGQDPIFFLTALFRGILHSFSLRGDATALTSAIGIRPSGTLMLFLVILGGFFLTIVMSVLKPVERFLLCWNLGHLLMMQMAIGVSIRHVYLPTIPATILVVMVSYRVFLAATQRLGTIRPEASRILATVLVFVFGSVFLIYPSIKDVREAQAVWTGVDQVTKDLQDQVHLAVDENPEIDRLSILNPTSRVVDPRFEIYSFHNGIAHLVKLSAPDHFRSLRVLHTTSENHASSSRWTNQDVLRRLLDNASSGVLFFDPSGPGFKRLTRRILDHQLELAEMIPAPFLVSQETRPDLPWQEGLFPWLGIEPGKKLNLQIEHPTDTPSWFFIHSLAEPGRQAAVSVNGVELGIIEVSGIAKLQWTHQILEAGFLGDGTDPARITITSIGSKSFNFGRLGFLPIRGDFSAPSTPEFYWSTNSVIKVLPGLDLTIPVPDCGSGPCTVTVIHRADFQGELSLKTSDGLIGIFGNPQEDHTPRWVNQTLSLPRWNSAWVSMKAESSRPATLAQLHFDLGDGSVMSSGGGFLNLYWDGPGGDWAQDDDQGRLFNPWLLGFAFLAGIAVLFLVAIVISKRT